MSSCADIGKWFTDTLERQISDIFQRAHEICDDIAKWIQSVILDPIESWLQQEEQRCREQECQWLCLCCNKWFCWLVVIIVSIVDWIIKILGKWLISTICNLLVSILQFIVMLIEQIVKWIVLAVVCIIESLCQVLLALGALAVLVFLLCIAASFIPALAALSGAVLIPALIIGVLLLFLAKSLCEVSWCRLFGAIGWALKWSIILGAPMSLIFLSALSAFCIAIFGGLLSTLIILLARVNCTVPSMRGWP
jgi:hypothetical protein